MRFVATPEADAHPASVEPLLGARSGDTVLTDPFATLWPNAPHRVLRSAAEQARTLDGETVGRAELGGLTIPIPRLAPMMPSRGTTGQIEAMALYAGQAVDAVREVRPAAQIVRQLTEGAEKRLRAASTAARRAGPPVETWPTGSMVPRRRRLAGP